MSHCLSQTDSEEFITSDMASLLQLQQIDITAHYLASNHKKDTKSIHLTLSKKILKINVDSI